jgi:hypothetical protein
MRFVEQGRVFRLMSARNQRAQRVCQIPWNDDELMSCQPFLPAG